jgi:adenylate cyclase
MSAPAWQALLAELKRRRVVRVALVYLAAAFAMLQAADILVPALHLPAWAVTFVVVLLALGFPIALALAWALELTPDGVRVTSSSPLPVGQPAPSLLGRRTVLAAALLIAVGAGLGAGWFLKPVPAERADAIAGAVSAINARTLAVLPFADLSESGDQQWFADGLAEEILTSLARLPELRVIGRNSSFRFTGSGMDDSLIAATLGVTHLVKGSVRRVGDRLRVTAQLVRAEDGLQLWSQSYDQRSADLLDVQRDVAENVAAALDVLLDDARRERMFALGTRNVEAFEAFLRGRQIYFDAHLTRGTPLSLADANAWFERALELDPRFGRAALLHADRYTHRVIFGDDAVARAGAVPMEEALERLRTSLDVAARHAPDDYWRVVAEINREFFAPTWHRLPGLIDELRGHAGDARPSADDNWLQFVLIVTRNLDLARTLAEQAVRADPQLPDAWGGLVRAAQARGDLAAARTLLDEARRTTGSTFRPIARTLAILEGDRAAALAELDDRSPLAAALRGERAALDRAREDLARHERPGSLRLLDVLHHLGDRDGVRDIVRQIDALPGGPAILAVQIYLSGGAYTFDPADTPNFAARLREAGVDPASFPVVRRLSLSPLEAPR